MTPPTSPSPSIMMHDNQQQQQKQKCYGNSNNSEQTTVYTAIFPGLDAIGPTPDNFNRYSPSSSEHNSLPDLLTIRDKMQKKVYGAFRERNIIVDILAIFFGIGTWIGVNGSFIQLPLLVAHAPEGWSLPSYLSIMVQIGNLGPLLYTTIQKYSPRKLNDSYTIYFILAIGTFSSLLTAFFYDRTNYIFGQEHSVPLFILTIFTAVNACTSSVLYMPYMGRFKEKYLITYFIGEGLSGLLPSVVALIQGVGVNECRLVNETESGGQIYEKYAVPPRFDTGVFFLILFALMVCSYVGFILLNRLKLAKLEYASMTVEKGNKYVYEKNQDDESNQDVDSENSGKLVNPKQYWALLLLIGAISFFSNGMFGSIQSYSTLPYGDRAYHLSATLSVIANPIACFLAMFLPFTSLRLITMLSVIAALLTSYVFTTAILSPFPPLYGTTAGSALVVTAWTLLHGFVSYSKLGITAVMRAQGGTSLVWVGGLTQLGSTFGSILIFLLINVGNYFKSAQTSC